MALKLFTMGFGFITLCCHLVLLGQAAPTSTKTLDIQTLLGNGRQAQELNVQFKSIKVTDPCNGSFFFCLRIGFFRSQYFECLDADKACLSEGVAVCKNGKWDAAPGACSKSQQCFALPSDIAKGVVRHTEFP
jgi:hypothetical protein